MWFLQRYGVGDGQKHLPDLSTPTQQPDTSKTARDEEDENQQQHDEHNGTGMRTAHG
jgi:hypothetical protein